MSQLLCFLDEETTGHDPLRRSDSTTGADVTLIPWHEIIEIGALVVDSQHLEILGEFEIKIAPRHPERCLPDLINHYPERAKKGEWDDAVSLECAMSDFLDFCGIYGGVNLIGQNFFFDWEFLHVALMIYGIKEDDLKKYFHYKKLDTASMAVQELLGPDEPYDPRNFSLRSGLIQERLNLESEPVPHTALNGAYQAYHVFKALRELRR